jgi:uncharacterized protein (UPF0333 family)
MVKIKKNMNIFSQKGATSILFGLLLLGMLFVISLTISILMLQQVKLSRQSGLSVVAFYAAESGAEKCLFQIKNSTGVGCDNTGQISDILDNLASYEAEYDSVNSKITSSGYFKGANRKIEIDW